MSETDADVRNVGAWAEVIKDLLYRVPSDRRMEVLALAVKNEEAARAERNALGGGVLTPILQKEMQMKTIVDHPAAALMSEVEAERSIASSPEAEALQEAICNAVRAYYEYLDCHGLFYDADRSLVKASGLHVICDMTGDMEIILKDGPADRRYGQGKDPDPFGKGCNPTWPPTNRTPGR